MKVLYLSFALAPLIAHGMGNDDTPGSSPSTTGNTTPVVTPRLSSSAPASRSYWPSFFTSTGQSDASVEKATSAKAYRPAADDLFEAEQQNDLGRVSLLLQNPDSFSVKSIKKLNVVITVEKSN